MAVFVILTQHLHFPHVPQNQQLPLPLGKREWRADGCSTRSLCPVFQGAPLTACVDLSQCPEQLKKYMNELHNVVPYVLSGKHDFSQVHVKALLHDLTL